MLGVITTNKSKNKTKEQKETFGGDRHVDCFGDGDGITR